MLHGLVLDGVAFCRGKPRGNYTRVGDLSEWPGGADVESSQRGEREREKKTVTSGESRHHEAHGRRRSREKETQSGSRTGGKKKRATKDSGSQRAESETTGKSSARRPASAEPKVGEATTPTSAIGGFAGVLQEQKEQGELHSSQAKIKVIGLG